MIFLYVMMLIIMFDYCFRFQVKKDGSYGLPNILMIESNFFHEKEKKKKDNKSPFLFLSLWLLIKSITRKMYIFPRKTHPCTARNKVSH